MKRKQGIITDFFEKISKLNVINSITEEHLQRDYELSTEFIKRNAFCLHPKPMDENEFRDFLNGLYGKIEEQVERDCKNTQANLNAYARDNEDSPTWFVTNDRPLDKADELEIIYTLYKFKFLSKKVITDEEAKKYKLTTGDRLIIAKAMTMPEGSLRKGCIPSNIMRRIEEFNYDEIGGVVRHLSKELVIKHIEALVSKICFIDNWPEIEIIAKCRKGNKSPKDSLYSEMTCKKEICKCRNCCHRDRDEISSLMTMEEVLSFEAKERIENISVEKKVFQQQEIIHEELPEIDSDQDELLKIAEEEGIVILDSGNIEHPLEVRRCGIDGVIGPVEQVESCEKLYEKLVAKDYPLNYRSVFDFDDTYFGMRILLESFSYRSRIKIALVCKTWYMAVRSNPMYLRPTRTIISELPVGKAMPMVRYLWQLGYRFNPFIVNRMLTCFCYATNYIMDIGTILNTYWNRKIDATCFILIVCIVMLEQYDPTPYAHKAYMTLNRIYFNLPRRITIKAAQCVRVNNEKTYVVAGYHMRARIKWDVVKGGETCDITTFERHSEVFLFDQW